MSALGFLAHLHVAERFDLRVRFVDALPRAADLAAADRQLLFTERLLA
jgi:hypothetical protein